MTQNFNSAHCGNPGLESTVAAADEFAATVEPVIRVIMASGVSSFNGIARDARRKKSQHKGAAASGP